MIQDWHGDSTVSLGTRTSIFLLHCLRTQLLSTSSPQGPKWLLELQSAQLRLLAEKMKEGVFPGGAVVENLPANAGDTGSSPGLGRSHMPWSNQVREPQLLSLRVWSLCSAMRGRDSERPAHRDEEWPPLSATKRKPSHRNEDPTQPKINK